LTVDGNRFITALGNTPQGEIFRKDCYFVSKGPKPPPNPPGINPRDPDIVKDPGPKQCWTFRLDEPTVVAANVRTGAAATGSIYRSRRVMVFTEGNALGFVPDAEAKEIIILLQEQGNKRLRGNILSDGKEDSHVLVELCLS
jgi:hypothetical protein